MRYMTLVTTMRKLWLPIAVASIAWLLSGAVLHSRSPMAHPHLSHGTTAAPMAGMAATAPLAARVQPAAGEVIVELTGFVFSPTIVTIEPGQTVTWIRRDGFHNVAADDGSYRSGEASSTWTSFSHTFPTAGESLYHCEVHGAAGGIGMAGKVVVAVAGASTPQVYLPLLAH